MELKFGKIARQYALLLLALSLGMSSAVAAPVEWLDANTVVVSDVHVKLTRPSERWRVDSDPVSGLLTLTYDQNGQDAVMHLKESPSLSLYSKFEKVDDLKQNANLIEHLITPYEEMGFQFYDLEKHGPNVLAMATNVEREILFLHFHLLRDKKRVVPLVLEMLIPREKYHDFDEAFYATAQSLSELSDEEL